jgi:hypothetical protein
MPDAIAKWLPLSNEIANVASTATGQQWIYSGYQKQIVDGIALGGIAGQALSVGAEKGPLAGALTFGVSVGLTYWFPNNYFHPIMDGIPKLLPKNMRKAAASSVGQGFIGLTMIIILESILNHAQHLVQSAPNFISTHSSLVKDGTRDLIFKEVKLEHAIALWILDSILPPSMTDDSRTRALLYLSGLNASGELFTSHGAVVKPAISFTGDTRALIQNTINSDVMMQLLSPVERIGINSRL